MKKRIKILIVVSNLEFGGAQRQIIELVNNIDHSKYIMYICSLSNYIPLANRLKRKDSVYIINKKFKYDLQVVYYLYRLISKLKIDIVHSYLFDADIASRLAGKMAKVAVIINSERNTNYHIKKRQLLAYNLTKKCVDGFIANSNSGAKFNSKKLKHSLSCYNIVYNGVDINYFKRINSERLKIELGLENTNKIVGMFASLKQQKNHLLFFKTARKILDVIPNVKFLIVGDMLYGGMHGSKNYSVEMHKAVERLGIKENCLFLGNRTDVNELYNLCDVTILPSLFEGTPNVLLESMACEVPVISSDVSDNSIIIKNGITGWVVKLSDEELFFKYAIDLLKNDYLKEKMGRAARSWISEEFSSRKMAEKTEYVYRKILNEKTRPKLNKINENNKIFEKKQGKKIRVAIATHFPMDMSFPDGGVEAVSVNLIMALKELQTLEIHVITFSYKTMVEVIEEKNGIIIHILPTSMKSKLLNSLTKEKKYFKEYLKNKIDPDILHVHDTYGIIASKIKIPKVLTIHGFINKDTLYGDTCFSRQRALVWKSAECSSWKSYNNIISITPYVKETVKSYCSPNFYEISNPIASSFFEFKREEKKGVIFSAAELCQRKNTLNLVKACKLLIEKGYDIQLRLAGSGLRSKYGRKIEGYVIDNKLKNRIMLLGQISTLEILEELKTASIFGLVSLEENSPMGIQEAMAFGIPIVTSNRCGMPYMVENGRSGYLVDPYDLNQIANALRNILDDDDLRYKMGNYARLSAFKNYSSKEIAIKTYETYLKILKHKN